MAEVRPHRHGLYLALCVGINVAAVVGYAAWSSRQAERQLIASVDQRLLQAALSLKHLLPPDYHDRAVGPESIDLGEVRRVQDIVSRFARETEFKYVYALVERDGDYYFSAPTVTPEELQERESWYFYPYQDVPEDFRTAMRQRRVVYSTYEDQWGTFRSVAVPQVSPGGRPYLACADCDIGYLKAAVARAYARAVATALGFLGICLPFVLLHRWSYRSHNAALTEVNRQLTRYQTHLEELVAERTADLEKARRQAEEASRLKSRFVANVSHDIRTPLNAIVGFSEGILASADPADTRRHAEAILRESETLLGLINDLLDQARIEAGRLALCSRPVDLGRLLECVVSTMNVQAAAKGLDLQLSVADPLPPCVLADDLRLRQILTNLVGNAIKFTERGQVEITVRARPSGAGRVEARFEVRDTGIGIPEDRQPFIFEGFTQADGSTTRRFGGFGLGTTIARELVELMGGRIGLHSRSGAGSTFWFTVPLEISDRPAEDAPAVTAARSADTLPKGRRGRILVVEDYPANREVARMHLEAAGHEVRIVCDGAQAVAACNREAFDLILMDLHMPEMDGLEATRRIRAGGGPCAAVPIIGLGAHADETSRLACLAAGMNDLAGKPIRRAGLLATVHRWLDRSADAPGAPVPPPPGEAGDPPIDYPVALREFGSHHVVNRLLEEFVDRVQQQVEALHHLLADGDLQAVRREAHAIRGGAATLEARPLAQVAGRLEELAGAGPPDGVAETLVSLAAEVDRLAGYAREGCCVPAHGETPS